MILSYHDYARDRTFDTEVAVVGTGAGGATVGAELAEAGVAVTFLEEGSHHPTSTFNPYITESLPRLYREAGATLILGTPPIPYVEGRCVGGTTVLNGGMIWRPPERVLENWQRLTGSADMGPGGLDPVFERVEKRIHASYQDEVSMGEDSRIMLSGARKLGWSCDVNRRNQHACVGANNCALGCPTGAKQSTLLSYLPRAFRAGARCLTEVRAERLLIERGRCTGIIGRALDPRTSGAPRELVVRAGAVVLACGAVQTPFLLRRHRLGRPGRHIGRHFACHPNAKVVASYPREVQAWKGVSQWAQIRAFHGEGIVMAENMAPPGVLAAYVPMHGREAWEFMKRYNNMIVSGVLVEDSTSGTVRRGPFGLPLVRYDITPYDHERFLKGIRHLAELHFAMGAEEVQLPFANFPRARSADDLEKLKSTQTHRGTLELFTVHLMGTARMGAAPGDSALDLNGELWALPGCHVADASVFPTPIGVNPQLTIMALATRVAFRLAERLRA